MKRLLPLILLIMFCGCSQKNAPSTPFSATYSFGDKGSLDATLSVQTDGRRFAFQRSKGKKGFPLQCVYDGEVLYVWNDNNAWQIRGERAIQGVKFWESNKLLANAADLKVSEEELLGQKVSRREGTMATWMTMVQWCRQPGDIVLRQVSFSEQDKRSVDNPEFEFVATEFSADGPSDEAFAVPEKVKSSAKGADKFQDVFRDRPR